MRQSTASAALSLFLGLTQASAHGQALGQPAGGQPQAPAASERADVTRQRIDREREAIQSTLLREQQACRQGFWVNACLSEARRARRQALEPLRQQELALNAQERLWRNEQRDKRLQGKQTEARETR